MKVTMLDAETLGADVCLKPLDMTGEFTIWQQTRPEQIAERIVDAEVVITNKLKLGAQQLQSAHSLKLICVTATGYDNIDTAYCKECGIAVCNVPGYSTDSVAQLTLAMVLSLSTRLSEYREYVNTDAYASGSAANCLKYPWAELSGKTWGIVGGGAIGQKVAEIAQALGCEVIIYRRKTDTRFENVDIDQLCRRSDVITIHLPLSDDTRALIDRKRISLMKPSVILVNTARGAVTDEQAIVDAIENSQIGAFGTDVYSVEPFSQTHPFTRLYEKKNVCLTPHMAWSALEARNRCIKEVALNIRSFVANEIRNRIV